MTAGEPRVDLRAEDVGEGLGQLVVALLEIVRQLLERQAIRRVEADELNPEEVERVGQALLEMERKLAELRDTFGGDGPHTVLPLEISDLFDVPHKER